MKKLRVDARWRTPFLVVIGAWLLGINAWGTPQSGFQPTGGLFYMLSMGLAFPAVLVGAALWRRSSRFFGMAGAVLTVAALLWTAYWAFYSHFGGFCLDPEDACHLGWHWRIAALIEALAVVVTARWANQPRSRDDDGLLHHGSRSSTK